MAYRQKDKRAGSLSLYHNLSIKSTYNLGINKFCGILRELDLTLSPLKVRIITTKGCLCSRVYKNLLNGLIINNYGKVVVGDLTYVLVNNLRFYIFSLFDVYSARMLGIWGSDRMRAQEAFEAMQQWINLRTPKGVRQTIHHTDGGSQYFSNLYLKHLKKLKVQISVAANCLQNGYAEQRNGLIKHHLLNYQYWNVNSFQKELKEIAHFYNYERKQEGLGWRTPVAYEKYMATLTEKERPKLELHHFG